MADPNQSADSVQNRPTKGRTHWVSFPHLGGRGGDLPLLVEIQDRQQAVDHYILAYRQYCWPVESLVDIRLAPFHVLATEGAIHAEKEHSWHMGWSRRLGTVGDGIVMATANVVVDLTNEQSLADGVNWWTSLTDDGGEGMVVKPIDCIVRGKRRLTQPALKCRGRESLRTIYGPEYTAPEHLDRLRSHGLGRKRGLALREFALGLEAMERFVRREPLRRVHECVFGVLALEGEPVAPHL